MSAKMSTTTTATSGNNKRKATALEKMEAELQAVKRQLEAKEGQLTQQGKLLEFFRTVTTTFTGDDDDPGSLVGWLNPGGQTVENRGDYQDKSNVRIRLFIMDVEKAIGHLSRYGRAPEPIPVYRKSIRYSQSEPPQEPYGYLYVMPPTPQQHYTYFGRICVTDEEGEHTWEAHWCDFTFNYGLQNLNQSVFMEPVSRKMQRLTYAASVAAFDYVRASEDLHMSGERISHEMQARLDILYEKHLDKECELSDHREKQGLPFTVVDWTESGRRGKKIDLTDDDDEVVVDLTHAAAVDLTDEDDDDA